MGILDKVFGDANEKYIKTLEQDIFEINSLEKGVVDLSDEALKTKSLQLKDKLGIDSAGEINKEKEQEKLNVILPEAFALVREAAKRVLNQRHFDVQLIGGIILHRGMIAEMKTGEGKTLVATLPLYLNALAGRGVQLVTVNDYLSRLGAGWMAPVFHLLGLTTGVIIHEAAYRYDPEYADESQYDDRLKHFRPVERRVAYQSDILYGTNNEFGFDYLRDNMVASKDQMVQRGLYYAIVDEIDSILIDEARTPLIISAPAEESTDKYYKFAQLVSRLVENNSSTGSKDSQAEGSGQGDYNVDEKMRAATLTETGIGKMEKWLGVENIYTAGGIGDAHHIEQALKAHALFKRDRDYVVKEGEVIIVDEFTGRLMHGRRYSEGLHQAIEAKEGVKIQRESLTLATITFQNYFRMYSKLAGMTGTAATEAEEFSKIYNLDTIIIPTNKPCIRQDSNDLIYRTEENKFKAVIAEIKRRHEAGQPVLVGTISIEKNERLADMMAREGITPQMLNAKNHEKEARIITQAGKLGAVTLATNMAGRGVDIVLGGSEVTNGDQTHEEWQKDHDRIVALGGLHVIGTERHESRRIDNQLRGRAGRQGDPGSSQFFVSMDDDLMRIFGGDRMKNIMTTLRVPEDMPIDNKFITKSIESAQKKVEGNNFDIRKHLVEYDDVINKHREAIYKRRREILELAVFENPKSEIINPKQIQNLPAGRQGSNDINSKQKYLSDIILEMVENEIEQVVAFHTAGEQTKDWNLNEIYQVVATIFPLGNKVKEDLIECTLEDHKLDQAKKRTTLIECLNKIGCETYDDIKKELAAAGISWIEIEKSILIRSMDMVWIEHLEEMSSVRQGIGLRGYGQRDPLVEYKKEAYRLYNELNHLIQKEVVYSIYKVGMAQESARSNLSERSLSNSRVQFSAPAKEMTSESRPAFAQVSAGRQQTTGINSPMAGEGSGREENSGDKVRPKVKDASGNKVGRNDPCPCGSGLKYKKCHGK